MFVAELCALAAAFCWSFGGILATSPARALGAVTFNRIRMILVFFMLAILALVTGGWSTLHPGGSVVLMASAIIGIFIGDTAFYSSLRRLGPRRTGVLFATNAPLAVLMGAVFLDERLPAATTVGCLLIMAGVFFAVFHGTTAVHRHSFEEVRGPMVVGVGLGLSAAICQATSIVILRPVLASGVDPVAASALRVGIGALALSGTLLFRSAAVRPATRLTRGLVGQIALSGLVGMALGMTFLLHALAHGPAGLVSTLSATSPILILPVLWVVTRERPAAGAWLGAALAVAGAGCIFS
ncbi:MAG: DMT family transporter [Syntrophobacteraceae bacterium]|nr:DMT family transporter [Syntrophobacteraceae bacterium]